MTDQLDSYVLLIRHGRPRRRDYEVVRVLARDSAGGAAGVLLMALAAVADRASVSFGPRAEGVPAKSSGESPAAPSGAQQGPNETEAEVVEVITKDDIDAVRAYRTALRSTYVSRDGDECGRTYNLVDEDAADALIAELEAEVERANELCIRDLEHTEKRAEQAEAEVELRDRMLRDIIERWNGL